MSQATQLALLCGACLKNTNCEHVLQDESLPRASKRMARWTDEELEFICATEQLPLVTVAKLLNRTYYAVGQVRSRLKRGIL